MASKSIVVPVALLLLLLVLTSLSESVPRPKPSKKPIFKPFSVQVPFKSQSLPKIDGTLRRDNEWPIPIPFVVDGSLTSDVRHRRAVYEASGAELYLIATPNSPDMSKVECLQGDGWFYSVKSTYETQVCLPWSEWPLPNLRFSKTHPVAGEPLCSLPFPLEQYPQCGLGYHCAAEQGKCVLSKTYRAEQAGVCPAESGLVWSRAKGRCVQCLASNLRLPTYTARPMAPDYYRLGYVCDSDGNAVPPLAASMAVQLYLIPSNFLFMCIFIVIIISTALFASLQCHKDENRYLKQRSDS